MITVMQTLAKYEADALVVQRRASGRILLCMPDRTKLLIPEPIWDGYRQWNTFERFNTVQKDSLVDAQRKRKRFKWK